MALILIGRMVDWQALGVDFGGLGL